MRSRFRVDSSSLSKAFGKVSLSGQDLLTIERPGAYVLVNGMRVRVPVDTAATQNSIQPHIVEATDQRVVDDVGPETDYSPYIEDGVESKPNYPAQPFVRPTVFEDGRKVLAAITTAFGRLVASRWPK